MKLTLLNKDTEVVRVVGRIHDLLHHSNGDLDITFDDASVIHISKDDYDFYFIDKEDK